MSQENEWGEMIAAIKEDHEKAKGGNTKYWAPPSDEEGTFPIRILPPNRKGGETRFYFHHFTHWIERNPYECLNQDLVDKDGNLHSAEECPICKFVGKLYKTAERGDEEWKLAGELSRKPRYVYRVVVRGSEDETVPKFYETGKMIFELLYHLLTETDYGIIVDPKNGRDFNLTKTGKKRMARYEQSLPSANTSPIFKDVESLKKVLTNMDTMPYNSLIEFVAYDVLKSALNRHLDIEEEQPRAATQATASVKANTKPVATEPPVEQDEDEVDDIDKILSEFGQE